MAPHIRKVNEPSGYHGKIKDWPKGERPREKLIKHGCESLSDAELLAILLRTGSGKVTAVDLARELLRAFGSLHQLGSRTHQELTKYHGLGEVKAVSLLASFELWRRTAAAPQADLIRITSPEDVVRKYQPLLRDLKHEVFKVLLLDSANQLLREIKVSDGILNSSLVHPREVFRPAILEPAASVILLHNHPSGNPEPSSEDLQITKQIVEAGKVIGIPVHDHIIITPHAFTSFAERGLL